MPIQGLDHINIHTSKREETLKFYTEMLDFQEGFRPPFDFPGAWLYAGERAVIHLVVREGCLLYTSPSPRDLLKSRMPSSA